LFLDEVHKYPQWAQELKNIYDNYLELKIVFASSSFLEILDARADVVRRAVVYTLQGLSYREYLNLVAGKKFFSVRLERHFSEPHSNCTRYQLRNKTPAIL